MGPLVATIRSLRQAQTERSDLAALQADPAADKELAAMARDEQAALGPRIVALEQELRLQLLPKDAADEKSAILEVRAGTGGDEAALFAADLFRMYSRYADLHGWKTEIISMSENDLGGYKEIVASITGQGRVRTAQVRIGRAPRAARARHRGQRAHPHLGRHRCRAARGRGRGGRDQARGHPHRHHARRRRWRPARQQDRIRPCASRTCRPASSSSRPRNRSTRTGAWPCRCCGPRLFEHGTAEGRRRPCCAAQGPGRHRRSLAAHPHLQFPAGPRDRPPHRPHAAQARRRCWKAPASTS